MKIEVVHFRELTDRLRRRWAELCAQSCAPMNGPFFRPEFAAIIDAVRGDVEVAIVEADGEVAALLPFHRFRGCLGKPVGLHLNDFQGFIGQLPEGLQAQEVIRACRLAAWDFDHVPTQQSAFAESAALTDISPYIDLSDGIEAYEQSRRASSQHWKDIARRQQKLAAEHGELRFEFNTRDAKVLKQLLVWKRHQFARTSVPDVLAPGWVREVVALIAAQTEPVFAGVTSALWAGDRLIAAESSPCSGSTYHLQWCAYDPAFHAYSPGRILNISLVRWAASQGFTRVEFAKGNQRHKVSAATGHHLVTTGSVVASPLQRALRGTWWTMRRWARSSPFRPHLKAAASYYYRLRFATPKAVSRGPA